MTYQGLSRRQKAHSRLVILQIATAVPLAYFLPASRILLVLTIALLVALSAFLLASISNRNEMLVLQALHVVVAAACVSIVIQPALRPSEVSSSLLIGVSCLIVVLVGLLQLPSAKERFPYFAQQTAIALLLQSWVLIEPIKRALLSAGIQSDDPARTGIAFLFAGPLALVGFVYLLMNPKWTRYWPAAVGFCLASYGMGLFHVGDEMGNRQLLRTGLTLIWTFLPALVLALFLGRRTKAGSSEMKEV